MGIYGSLFLNKGDDIKADELSSAALIYLGSITVHVETMEQWEKLNVAVLKCGEILTKRALERKAKEEAANAASVPAQVEA